jgi:hypothetical protein
MATSVLKRNRGSKLRAPRVQEKFTAQEVAEAAVITYEGERQLLEEMQEAFTQDFPDAHAALMAIKKQEDIVLEAINKAHPLVQAAKETIGDFKCTRKFAAASYDPVEVTKLLSTDEEQRSSIVDALFEAGVVKKIELHKDAMTSFTAQHPDYAEYFQVAWKEKTEKTAAVTTPKL